MTDELRAVGERFAIAGRCVDAQPLGRGHIHETFVSSWERGGARVAYVHQRINTRVFSDPAVVMQNIVRVTTHLRAALARQGARDLERRVLTLVPARDARPFVVAPDGSVWRTFLRIEGAVTREIIAGPAEAFEAARAFATFAGLLADLPAPPLAVTLAGFHDLGKRFGEFEAAVASDASGRATSVRAEIDAIRATHARLSHLLSAADPDQAPRRVMHHDCKLNNLLLDAQTGEALCVIDLDTVMLGCVLSDFGELVRTAASRSPEDEPRLETIAFDLELFAALARGYAAGARDWLDGAEGRLLPLAGPLLALMNAIRFLADHVAGDVYFRVHREGQNLDRCRAQLTLTTRMLERLPEARRIVASALGEAGGARARD
jgi:aminoglycoside phosphotransferase (APT) family kinase protein